MRPTNQFVIQAVVSTVCLLALIGVSVEAACAFWKIPDMSGSLSSGFTHVVDTLVGALIAMLINTRPQDARKPEDLPAEVTVVNPPESPAQTHANP